MSINLTGKSGLHASKKEIIRSALWLRTSFSEGIAKIRSGIDQKKEQSSNEEAAGNLLLDHIYKGGGFGLSLSVVFTYK